MNEKGRAFIELAKADPELAEKLTKMTAEELVAAAKARGVELTAEDFASAEGELDDAEQENIAGGDCICVVAGGGGGTDANDGHTYGCACALYGQGGDGHLGDANCLCPIGGVGKDDYPLDEDY